MTSVDEVVADVRWDERGLVPVVVQDARTQRVLMLAYMNVEALTRTLASREMWFWSRSRGELWHKGSTSGHRQRVIEIRRDCDSDALLCRVIPLGPACHTGQISCFHQPMLAPSDADTAGDGMLDSLWSTIQKRKAQPKKDSYTCDLLTAGEPTILKKLGEESVEVIVAGLSEGNERLVYELADLAYHTLVLLAARDLSWMDVEAELARRFVSQAGRQPAADAD